MPVRRNTIRFNFVHPPELLEELVSRIPNTTSFIQRHGSLLSLVTAKRDQQLMSVLTQFYDPLYQCFTFQDFQLVPTLEEFSDLLGIPILDQTPFTGWEKTLRLEDIAAALPLTHQEVTDNWVTRSGVKGFLAKFLIGKANSFWNDLDFRAYEDILALLIYGLVLFPNPDNFINVTAIRIFMSQNPVPTLLGDILQQLHARTTRRRGTLWCCIPLLVRWFISHLPKFILKNQEGRGWAHRLMSLTDKDIIWTCRGLDEIAVIDRCGEYPNVPLIGTQGGISYNPCLALRQFGRARRAGPHEMLVPHISFEFQVDSDELRRRFIKAWDKVHKADPQELGPKTSLPMEAYYKWVRIRAQKLGMPYEAVRPVILECPDKDGVPPTVLPPQIPTDYETLKRSWSQLREERDSYREKFNEQELKI